MFPNKDKIFSKGNWFNLILNIGIYVLIFLFILLSLRYQYFLLEYMEWGDESETIVTSKMMVAGMKLYSEIFNSFLTVSKAKFIKLDRAIKTKTDIIKDITVVRYFFLFLFKFL